MQKPVLYANSVRDVFVNFRGSGPILLGNRIFCDFQGRGMVRTPCPPLDPRMLGGEGGVGDTDPRNHLLFRASCTLHSFPVFILVFLSEIIGT